MNFMALVKISVRFNREQYRFSIERKITLIGMTGLVTRFNREQYRFSIESQSHLKQSDLRLCFNREQYRFSIES